MAEFMLRGSAQSWFNLVRRSLGVGQVLTWEDFEARFVREYRPDSLCQRRAFEFEMLTCETCGTVDEYARKFMELYEYAPSLVDTDAKKVQRFVRGLPTHMRRVLIVHNHITFAEVVDRVRQMEGLDEEQKVNDMGESSKK